MSFDNGTKLSFFSASTPSNDFAISIVRGFTNSFDILFFWHLCGLFFWQTEKQLYKMRATTAYLSAKIHAFLRYHSDESVPF